MTESVPKARIQPWAALRYRNFTLLWLGQLAATLGMFMQGTVRAWQLYELTNSALAIGLIGLVSAAPMVAFALVGGAVADTMDRRRLVIITQAVALVLAIVQAELTALGLMAPWMIYAITFIASVAIAFDAPARSAMAPTLVPPTHINNAMTLIVSIRHLGLLIGPMVGGFVIAGFGIAEAYWLNVATSGALIVAVLAMRLPSMRGGGRPRVDPSVLLQGMRFMWSVPIIITVMGMDFFTTFFGMARAILPVFARDVYEAGPQGLGFLAASPAVGGLLGVCTALAIGDIRRKGIAIVLCMLGFGIAIGGFAIAPTIVLACVGMAAYGYVDSIADTLRYTILQTETPNEVRGRVNSAANMLEYAGPYLGQLWVGFLAATLGAREGVGLGAAVIVVVALLLALFARPLIRYQLRPGMV